MNSHTVDQKDGVDLFWSAVLVALPFLPIAASIATYRYLHLDYAVTGRIQLFSIVAFLALAFVGWMRGFPAWCFPYLTIVASVFLAMCIGSDSDMTFWENLGWKVMVLGPVVLIFFLFWFFTRRRFPLGKLVEAVRLDWTLIPFTVYNLLLLVIQGLFTDIRSTYGAPYLLFSTLIGMTGAALYILLPRKSWCFAALVVCFTACWLVIAVGSATFWDGRQESWMKAPADGLDLARGYATAWALMLVVMCLPLLVRWIKSRLPAKIQPVR